MSRMLGCFTTAHNAGHRCNNIGARNVTETRSAHWELDYARSYVNEFGTDAHGWVVGVRAGRKRGHGTAWDGSDEPVGEPVDLILTLTQVRADLVAAR